MSQSPRHSKTKKPTRTSAPLPDVEPRRGARRPRVSDQGDLKTSTPNKRGKHRQTNTEVDDQLDTEETVHQESSSSSGSPLAPVENHTGDSNLELDLIDPDASLDANIKLVSDNLEQHASKLGHLTLRKADTKEELAHLHALEDTLRALLETRNLIRQATKPQVTSSSDVIDSNYKVSIKDIPLFVPAEEQHQQETVAEDFIHGLEYLFDATNTPEHRKADYLILALRTHRIAAATVKRNKTSWTTAKKAFLDLYRSSHDPTTRMERELYACTRDYTTAAVYTAAFLEVLRTHDVNSNSPLIRSLFLEGLPARLASKVRQEIALQSIRATARFGAPSELPFKEIASLASAFEAATAHDHDDDPDR